MRNQKLVLGQGAGDDEDPFMLACPADDHHRPSHAKLSHS
jgi:hypothetical protein